MATFLKNAKDRVTSKVEMCKECIKYQIEEVKGHNEEIKRQMSIIEYHSKKGQGFALKANNGKYLTTSLKHLDPCEASNFEASKDEVDESCHFFIEKFSLKKVTKIRSH